MTHEEILDGEFTEVEAPLVKADEKVLARLGTPEQRRAALVVLAQSLKIPQDAFESDPNLHGSLALAIQYAGEYGFVPGVHFHAVSRKTKINGRPVETYTIQDGEKAWKESAARLGIDYRFQDRVMTRAEVLDVAKSMGCSPKDVSEHAAGVWSRVITREDVEWGLVTDTSPIWQAGVWLGVTKAGQYWNKDNLPTGTTPTDVATRRAHKRALMSSTITLTPLDSRSPKERYEQLSRSLVHEAEAKAADEHAQYAERARIIEDDGDELFEPAEKFVKDKADPEPDQADEDLEPWFDWNEPADAYSWAGGQGISEDDAKAVFASAVGEHGGRLTKKNMPDVFKTYHKLITQA